MSVVRDKLPHTADPAKAGDAVVAPKQTGAQGFYKVWVSDAPIEAELGAADLPRSRLSAAIASMIRDG